MNVRAGAGNEAGGLEVVGPVSFRDPGRFWTCEAMTRREDVSTALKFLAQAAAIDQILRRVEVRAGSCGRARMHLLGNDHDGGG